MSRTTDQTATRTYFRSNRFFAVGERWFFTTRESGDRGPFHSREKAEEALAEYLHEHSGRPLSPWDVPGAGH